MEQIYPGIGRVADMIELTETSDGSFTVGKEGVKAIYTPLDQKVEFANAELDRVRVCLIGNSKLSKLVHSLIPEFEAVASITIIDNIFNDAVRAARDLIEQQAVDVFISAGANAFYLNDTLPMPVLALKVEQTDLIQARFTGFFEQLELRLDEEKAKKAVRALLRSGILRLKDGYLLPTPGAFALYIVP